MKDKTKQFLNEVGLSLFFYISLGFMLAGVVIALLAYDLTTKIPEGSEFVFFTIISAFLSFAISFIALGVAFISAYRALFTDAKIILIQRALFCQNLNFLEESRQWYNNKPELLSWKTLQGIEIATQLNTLVGKKSVITFKYQNKIWRYFVSTLEFMFKNGFTWFGIESGQRANFISAYAYLYLYFEKEPETIFDFANLLNTYMNNDEKNDFFRRALIAIKSGEF